MKFFRIDLLRKSGYFLFFFPFCVFSVPWKLDLSVGGGWRSDTSRQQIFEPSFSSDSPAYQQTIRLTPLWEMRGIVSGEIGKFRWEGEVAFAPFSRGWESIHDFERSVGPNPLEAIFHTHPSGYAFQAVGNVSYRISFLKYFALLPLVGYVYDELKCKRKNIDPSSFHFPNGAVSTPDFKTETDQAWGPALGAVFAIRWIDSMVLEGGYAYQFLNYRSTYVNQLHIVLPEQFDQNVNVHRDIHTSHAFAHQAIVRWGYQATKHFRISLNGGAVYRYVNERKCSHTRIDIEQSLPESSTIQIDLNNETNVYWKTLYCDLLFSYVF